EPSSVVRELQYMLRGFIDEKTLAKLTVEHPVSRYDLKYFPEFIDRPTPDAEREFASFDPDARRGARMLALRKKIAGAAAHRAKPDREPLLDRLGGKLRECLQADLQFAEFDAAPNAARQAPAEEIELPIAALRKYLECPLQGAARYALGMLEDEDAPEDVEDEPIQQSRLDRTVMLREVFRRARANLDEFHDEYARQLRIAQANGRAPAG